MVMEQFLGGFADLGLGVVALSTTDDGGSAFESRCSAVEYKDRLGVRNHNKQPQLKPQYI